MFPKFDYLTQDWNKTKPASNSDKSDPNGNYFRLDRGQLATVGYDFGRMMIFREPTVKNSGFAYSEPTTKKPMATATSPPLREQQNVAVRGFTF